MITYAIHIVLFSFGFWSIYYLFRKETFFNANRFVLLMAPVLAIALPLISLDFLRVNLAEHGFIQGSKQFLEVVIIDTQPAAPILNQTDTLFTLSNFLLGIYLLGVSFSLILFLRSFIKVLQLRKEGKEEFYAGTSLIVLPDRQDAFTFLNTIFIGAEIDESQKQTIVTHEKVHLEERHSWDLLYFEMLKILFWFNPFFYVFQNHISVVHEFIADQKTIKNQHKAVYTEVLLNSAFNTEQFSFINLFFTNHSLKTRIMMLHKSKSTHLSKFKYLLSIPLIMLMLTYVSCSDDPIQDNNATEEMPPPPPNLPDKEDFQRYDIVQFSELTSSPAFPETETFENPEEGKTDFQQRIQQHVAEHYNTDVVDEFSGEIRINTQFEISDEGAITEIKARAPQKELEVEAIRVLELLPKMKPGMVENKPVKVIFQLPITFQSK